MISKELFVNSIEALRLQLGEDKVNASIIAEVFGVKDDFCLYDNNKLINAIIDLLAVDFEKNELEHYCFVLNFGKISDEECFESTEELYNRLSKKLQL
jgi:hypothetical protein